VVDPELPEILQDLGYYISAECTNAIREAHFPGVVDIDPISNEHVTVVMQALNREMKREATRRGKTWVDFTTLPWERQVALAERRRYWYSRFGITPAVWAREEKTFSLWDVSDEPLPTWLTTRH